VERGDPICTVLAEAATATDARRLVADRQARLLADLTGEAPSAVRIKERVS
jgi:predicted ATP-grasp superfamily ATP-dependent carboligase